MHFLWKFNKVRTKGYRFWADPLCTRSSTKEHQEETSCHPGLHGRRNAKTLSSGSHTAVKVQKGSIGLTEQFCNIYTYESPGGWNIIGNTPLEIFNKENRSKPALINPGDKVKFNRITQEEYDKIIR